MKSRKNHFLIILFLLFVTPYIGYAQLVKGDFTVDFSISSSYSNSAPNILGSFVRGDYMKMITDDLMVGGALRYSRGYASISNNEGTEYFPVNSYTAKPSIRYYFSTNKIASFTTLQNYFYVIDYRKEGFREDRKGYRAELGIGFNYFLNKNIALECLLISNMVSLGDLKNEAREISFSSGLKLFFNDSINSEVESLPEKFLRKGNLQTTASLLGYIRRFEEISTGYLNITPNLRYFISDRFNVFGSLRFSEYRFSTNDQYVLGLGLGAEYFFKLNEILYMNVNIKGTLTYDASSLIALSENSNSKFVIPVSSALYLFHEQKRIYLGGRFQYEQFYLPHVVYKTFSLFAGLDYFLSENIYLNGELNYSLRDNSNSDFQRQTSALSLGFGLIFNSNRSY